MALLLKILKLVVMVVKKPKISNMEGYGELKIVSFNCCGVENKLPIINALCENNHIVLLQETWLLPHNLDILNNAHEDFDAYSVFAVDLSEGLIGRPYGGLSIMWRKNLSKFFDIVNFDDVRILGFDFKHGD